MVRSRDVVQAEGSARTEGARRATGVRADGAAAGAGSLAPGQRWSASRKRDVVLRLLRGESREALSREVGVEIDRLEAWRERAMAGLDTGPRSAWGGTCAKSGAASRHSIRLRKGSNVAMARWTPTSPAGWRFGWIPVVSTCQTTSSSRSGIGGSTPASALSRNRKRTVWRSGGIVRSRSKRSTAESFRTSRPSAPPWPTSWSGTTRPGALRSLGIKRRSRRARRMSYARRHRTNVCPGNRVRYMVMMDGFRILTIPRHNPVNAYTMAGVVRDAGLTEEQFRKLL